MPTKKKTTIQKKTALLHRKAKRVARNAIVPHAKNHYRPYVVRRYGLAAVLALVIAVQFGYNFIQTGSVLGRVSDVTRQSLLATTNQARSREGVARLAPNPQLNAAAEAKINDMFTEQYWSHDAPDGTTPWLWVEQAGYKYNHAGENLAKGFTSANGVVVAWLNSPEHRDNLLDNKFTDVGFAVKTGNLRGEQTTVVVALYGTPDTGVGAIDSSRVLAAVDNQLGPISRLGVGLQSMTPAALGSILILILVGMVAMAAHVYRHKLPKALRQSWYRYHGLYKLFGLAVVVLILVSMYSGGQI